MPVIILAFVAIVLAIATIVLCIANVIGLDSLNAIWQYITFVILGR